MAYQGGTYANTTDYFKFMAGNIQPYLNISSVSKSILAVNTGDQSVNNNTSNNYWAAGSASWQTTEAMAYYVIPTACTIKNLYAKCYNKSGVTITTCTLTVRKNASDTALTCGITVFDGSSAASDTTHSFTAAAGDVISFKAAADGSTGFLSRIHFAVEIDI